MIQTDSLTLITTLNDRIRELESGLQDHVATLIIGLETRTPNMTKTAITRLENLAPLEPKQWEVKLKQAKQEYLQRKFL